MSPDLTLEEKKVLDYVKGKIPEPPSNAPTTTKNKYTKGGRKDIFLPCNKFCHYVGSVRIEGTHHLMMIKIIPGVSSMIIGMIVIMENGKGMQVIKEMVEYLRKQGSRVMLQGTSSDTRKYSLI